MLKYKETQVTFSEVPEEITLCINITNCPCKCEGCHSPHLAEDIGDELNEESLSSLIESNRGITCVALMGGDSSPNDVHTLALYIRVKYPELKIAWYSGREEIPTRILLNLQDYDYIKLGPYIADKGPLNNPNTNQRFYKVEDERLVDITYKFWKDEIKD